MKQSLVGEEIISVKWAYDDPNPMTGKILEKEEENKFITAVKKKQEEEERNIMKNNEKLQEILKNIEQYNQNNNE